MVMQNASKVLRALRGQGLKFGNDRIYEAFRNGTIPAFETSDGWFADPKATEDFVKQIVAKRRANRRANQFTGPLSADDLFAVKPPKVGTLSLILDELRCIRELLARGQSQQPTASEPEQPSDFVL